VDIVGYLAEVQRIHATGVAQEHAYRPALEKLFRSITPDVTAINEPKGIKVGRPDFVFLRSAGKGADITVGHCEAKDVGLGINPKGMNDFNKAQHERYVKALPNLIYTNGLDFRFYKKGELAREISIADLLMGIQPKPDQFSALENQLKDFCAERLQTITSAEKLADMMAGKAVLIKDILFNSLKDDAELQTELVGQYQSFKKMLIHDLSAEDFADIYAETIAYGMFGARLHDKTLENFSRVEALELMPKSNPFLRYLFTYVAGPNLDERIRRTIDELAEIFQATDLQKLFEDFGKFTQRNDPFIHFYETFLAEYNPAKRKARGVWYTPEPVVNFIVRAVDDVLKTEFGLPLGLADTSKVTIDWDTGETKKGKPVTERREVHRVQILDPAAGTGTFLAEVIKQIAPKVKDVAEGQWSSYVEKELIPRLHGFELLMASYAMCHMKLDMMLTEMGYKPTANPPRMGVYLTNSLEEGEREIQDLFWAKPLSEEARQANSVKRDMPIMCVIGNPPYSGVSQNNGHWITQKIEDYKYVDGRHFDEKKHWLQDDYVKFIRFAEHLIEKNGEGVLGFITNHGYLENTTFRAMRWHLLQTFDEVRVLDLHGSSIKGQVSPDGGADKNVFDIQVGVAIVIAFKNAKKKKDSSAKIFHGNLWGSREDKYGQLWSLNKDQAAPTSIQPCAPLYLFAPPPTGPKEEYDSGFQITDLMPLNITGIVTMGDSFIVSEKPSVLRSHVQLLHQSDTTIETLNSKFGLGKNYAEWIFKNRNSIAFDEEKVVRLAYRPLDTRYTYFDNKLLWRWREPVMRHLINGDNFALLLARQTKDEIGGFVVNCIAGHKSFSGYDITSCLPFYLHAEQQSLDRTRRINFDPKIHKAIVEAVAGPSRPAKGRAPQGEGQGKVPDEVAIFDYIYGVLHCPAYRATYREFLKIDFPRVPYPPSPEVFWDVSAKGTQLRRLHLMEDEAIGATPYKFTGEGAPVVGKVQFKPLGEKDGVVTGAVYINGSHAFQDVPEIAWTFYIGGYQPAQKWLKDRKDRELSFEDIKHYQKIIKILSETDRIMKTIEMPLG
jgi:type I restriction-modification system DNA methylase subunit